MPSVQDFGSLSSPVLSETDQGMVSPTNSPVTVFYSLLLETDQGASDGDTFATVAIPPLFVKDAVSQDGSGDRGQVGTVLTAHNGTATGGTNFPTTQATTFVVSFDANPEWYKIDALDTVTHLPTSWEGHYSTAPSPNTNHPVTNTSVTQITPMLPETDGRS